MNLELSQSTHRIRTFVLVLFVAATILSGCGNRDAGSVAQAPAAPATAESQEQIAPLDLPVNVDAETVNRLRDRKDVVILDVREDWEFAEGHIPNAQWIPLGQLPDRINEVPTDKTVIAVCRSGNRSTQATNFLRQQGLDNVHNMNGGMIAWEKAGFTIEATK
jgi:rhodanese-related sulfurtransferase